MTDLVAEKLQSLGLALPKLSAAVANYRPYVISGDHVFISGQLPMQDGKVLYQGIMGGDATIEDGVKAASLCGLNILAQLHHAIEGDWNRVKACVKLGGFVTATSNFTDHPKIINGASDLMVAVFGEKGRHARFAMGAASLPLGALVEIEAIFQIEN